MADHCCTKKQRNLLSLQLEADTLLDEKSSGLVWMLSDLLQFTCVGVDWGAI